MAIDPRTLRQTLGQFVTGVTVVAVDVGPDVHAMTANSFTSLSLDPPLVLFCVGKESKAGQMLRVGIPFSVNILTQAQRDLSTYFAGSWKADTPPSFTFEPWHGAARLAGSAAVIACSVDMVHEGGDHWIVVGKVDAAEGGGPDDAPLIFYRGRYAALDSGRYTQATPPHSHRS